MKNPTIQWYPGHIAKAERQLKENLSRVDVVLEIRDARIPLSTNHPQLDGWLGEKSRVLVLNRRDAIPDAVRHGWDAWFRDREIVPLFTDAKQGKGVGELSRAAEAAGRKLNDRRKKRGMQPRPVRAVVIGFPNVGKSALINRLLRKKVVESARMAGVTRQLRWVRISDKLELLDAPGIIPWQLPDQTAAVKLAICDDIGQASYSNFNVAAQFVDLLAEVIASDRQFNLTNPLIDRYDLAATDLTGESYVEALAHHRYSGDIERAARQLLNDFRTGKLGTMPLELPPDS
ncbi:MAG: ribosome biogenesis GTPase YlqF [Oscillatoriales cyanobacterium]|nr:MAG: ribosome biogenesis GTPase YlqF [Oscillatoriales cyanobacterium]